MSLLLDTRYDTLYTISIADIPPTTSLLSVPGVPGDPWTRHRVPDIPVIAQAYKRGHDMTDVDVRLLFSLSRLYRYLRTVTVVHGLSVIEAPALRLGWVCPDKSSLASGLRPSVKTQWTCC